MAWWVVAGGLVACNGGGSGTGDSFTATVPDTTTTIEGSTTAPTTTTPTSTAPTTTGEPPADTSTTTTSGDATSSTTAVPTTSGDDTTSTGGDESTTDETTTGSGACEAPGVLNVCDDGDDMDPFHALGLGCAGAVINTLPIANQDLDSKVVAYTVARGFGTAEDPQSPGQLLFRPHEGEKLLIVSTGQVGALNGEGVLVEAKGSQFDNANNFNPDTPDALPAPMSPAIGSNNGQGGTPFNGCDGVHDCSDSIDPNWMLGNGDPNDLLFAKFDITVPGGTYGFEFDVAYFSSEYPAYVGKQFNDMFIGWSTSEAYTGNVTFYDEQPFTVTALAKPMEQGGYVDADPALAGTGFEGYGSTGWTTVSAPTVPGETFTFAFAIMDMGDSSKATLAVLDNWRWSCKGCLSVDVDPLCGMEGHPKCCGLCVTNVADPDCGMPGHPMCCVPG